jgi:hypothetical protein
VPTKKQFLRRWHRRPLWRQKARLRPPQIPDLYLMEIDGSQHHGSITLSLLFEELARCSLLNYFAQPDKLICPLIWLHVTPTVKIVHCRSADCAQNYLAVIEHRELKDHPIEVVTVGLASLQYCNLTV